MTSSIGGVQSSSTPVHGHHHHRRDSDAASQADPFASGTSASSPGSTPASGATAPGAGVQKFASELQSILLNAQSGQQATSATPANTAAGSNPTPAEQSGPIRHLADRLQELLGNSTPATTSSSAPNGASGSLDSVLNTLQQTLQHTLSRYGSQANASSSTSLTA